MQAQFNGSLPLIMESKPREPTQIACLTKHMNTGTKHSATLPLHPCPKLNPTFSKRIKSLNVLPNYTVKIAHHLNLLTVPRSYKLSSSS